MLFAVLCQNWATTWHKPTGSHFQHKNLVGKNFGQNNI